MLSAPGIFIYYTPVIIRAIVTVPKECIYISDWNGNPVKKLKLDRNITGFAISDNDSEIYAFDPGTGYIVHSTLKN